MNFLEAQLCTTLWNASRPVCAAAAAAEADEGLDSSSSESAPAPEDVAVAAAAAAAAAEQADGAAVRAAAETDGAALEREVEEESELAVEVADKAAGAAAVPRGPVAKQEAPGAALEEADV